MRALQAGTERVPEYRRDYRENFAGLWERVRPDIMRSQLSREGRPKAFQQFDPRPLPVLDVEMLPGGRFVPVQRHYAPEYGREDEVVLAQEGVEEVDEFPPRPWKGEGADPLAFVFGRRSARAMRGKGGWKEVLKELVPLLVMGGGKPFSRISLRPRGLIGGPEGMPRVLPPRPKELPPLTPEEEAALFEKAGAPMPKEVKPSKPKLEDILDEGELPPSINKSSLGYAIESKEGTRHFEHLQDAMDALGRQKHPNSPFYEEPLEDLGQHSLEARIMQRLRISRQEVQDTADDHGVSDADYETWLRNWAKNPDSIEPSKPEEVDVGPYDEAAFQEKYPGSKPGQEPKELDPMEDLSMRLFGKPSKDLNQQESQKLWDEFHADPEGRFRDSLQHAERVELEAFEENLTDRHRDLEKQISEKLGGDIDETRWHWDATLKAMTPEEYEQHLLDKLNEIEGVKQAYESYDLNAGEEWKAGENLAEDRRVEDLAREKYGMGPPRHRPDAGPLPPEERAALEPTDEELTPGGLKEAIKRRGPEGAGGTTPVQPPPKGGAPGGEQQYPKLSGSAEKIMRRNLKKLGWTDDQIDNQAASVEGLHIGLLKSGGAKEQAIIDALKQKGLDATLNSFTEAARELRNKGDTAGLNELINNWHDKLLDLPDKKLIIEAEGLAPGEAEQINKAIQGAKKPKITQGFKNWNETHWEKEAGMDPEHVNDLRDVATKNNMTAEQYHQLLDASAGKGPPVWLGPGEPPADLAHLFKPGTTIEKGSGDFGQWFKKTYGAEPQNVPPDAFEGTASHEDWMAYLKSLQPAPGSEYNWLFNPEKPSTDPFPYKTPPHLEGTQEGLPPGAEEGYPPWWLFQRGTAQVPNTDSVPAMLTPGEAVLNRYAAEMFGRGKIRALNQLGSWIERMRYFGAVGKQLSRPSERGYNRGTEKVKGGKKMRKRERFMPMRNCQSGSSMVRPIGYVSPEQEDPKWQQVQFQGGLNLADIAKLKEGSRQKGISSQTVSDIMRLLGSLGKAYGGGAGAGDYFGSGYGAMGAAQSQLGGVPLSWSPVAGYQGGDDFVEPDDLFDPNDPAVIAGFRPGVNVITAGRQHPPGFFNPRRFGGDYGGGGGFAGFGPFGGGYGRLPIMGNPISGPTMRNTFWSNANTGGLGYAPLAIPPGGWTPDTIFNVSTARHSIRPKPF